MRKARGIPGEVLLIKIADDSIRPLCLARGTPEARPWMAERPPVRSQDAAYALAGGVPQARRSGRLRSPVLLIQLLANRKTNETTPTNTFNKQKTPARE